MLDNQLAELASLWTTELDDYVLFNNDPNGTDLSRCLILNRRHKTIKLIENRELVLEVMRSMLEAGVKMASELPAE